MKKQRFSLIELIAVITIMSILLTMIVTISKPDRAKADTKVIGGLINLYHAKSQSLFDGELYTFNIDNTFTITDENGDIVESKEITAPLLFLDGSTSKSFSFNNRGEVTDLSKVLRFKVGVYKVKINNFTGRFSYYDELAQY